MKEPSIKKNYLFNSSYQILSLIVPLITTPYVSRVLGAHGIGIYSYTFSIVSYFVLFSALGTSTYSNRNLSIIRDNIVERTKFFWNIFSLRAILASISLVIYFTYVIVLSENKFIAALQGIYLIDIMMDITWFFQGMENFKIIAIRNYVIKLVNVIFIFTVVKDESDLWWYVLGLAGWSLLANISMWIPLRKLIKKPNIKGIRPFNSISIIIQLFVPTIASQIYTMLDKSMIGWISGKATENGCYEQSDKIVKMSIMLILALGTVTIPKISRLFAQGKMEGMKKLLYRSYRFVWALGCALMFGVIGINFVLVPVFFGPGYDRVKIILPILSTLFIIMGLNHTNGRQYLISTGRQKAYMYIVIVGGIINVLVNAACIPFFGAVGAAIGSVVGEIVILIVQLIYVYKLKEFEVYKIFSSSWHYIIAGVVMMMVTLFAQRVLPANFIGLAALIVIGAVCYCVILLIFRDEFAFMGLNIVKNSVNKIFKRKK